jgi:hypothetical protein
LAIGAALFYILTRVHKRVDMLLLGVRVVMVKQLVLIAGLVVIGATPLLARGAQRASETQAVSISSASLLGGAGNADAVRGARIQSDGSIVLAVNLSALQWAGAAQTLLNGASDASEGAIIRLSADGRSVKTITRVAARINDVSIDGQDNIYVAAWSDGLLKLSPDAGTLAWRLPQTRTLRVDAATDGTVAALVTTASDPDTSAPGAGQLVVVGPDGAPRAAVPGRHNTLDVCVDGATQRVVSIGWRQASVAGVPVQIAYLKAIDFAGADQYTLYDWSTTSGDARFINTPTNNMADTRGYRCSIGADGRLYAAFEAAGGNHIFRYSPIDINARVTLAGGDQWQTFSNTRSEHKTVFARFDIASGAFLAGQEYLARLGPDKNNAGNALRVDKGAISADASGRVYIGGASAWGLPMPPHPRFTPSPEKQTFNHLESDAAAYLGGAWLTVFSPDFKTREFTTRLATGGSTYAIDARQVGSGIVIAAGGVAAAGSVTTTHTVNALQASSGGAQEGWMAVMNSGPPPATSTPAPTNTPDPALTQRVFLPLSTR